VCVAKKRKKGQKLSCVKLAICPDHPRRYSPLKFCMRGRAREVVIYFKCNENRLRGLGAVGLENRPLPLTRPMAYTKACTTVQVTPELSLCIEALLDETNHSYERLNLWWPNVRKDNLLYPPNYWCTRFNEICKASFVTEITAGTLVPAVLMETSHSYGNGKTWTTHRIRTP